MKNKKEIKNYLDNIPVKNKKILWSADENGNVTLEKENEGTINRIFQKLLKKPKKSYIHLDELGSLIWISIDGKKSILDFGKSVKEKSGEKSMLLYEKLARYFQLLSDYGFINWKE